LNFVRTKKWCSIAVGYRRAREDSMSTLRQTTVVTALLVTAAIFGVRTSMAADATKVPERTVSVSATGSVAAEPDIAYISTGVVTEAATARDALSSNNAAMSKIVSGLKGASIPAKDIQTISINVEPRYETPKDKAPFIRGYRVHNQVRITARDIKRLGDVLDQTVTLGANQINSIAFEVSAAEQLKDEARKIAMANAMRRAKLYAAAAGADIGEVLTIAEDVRMAAPPRPMARASLAAESVPIEAGTQRLEVQVHVTWALR
jgi:uncharacterized protein YggE